MLVVDNDLNTAYIYMSNDMGYCLYSGTEQFFFGRWGKLPEYNEYVSGESAKSLHVASDEERYSIAKRLLEIREFYELTLPAYKTIYDTHLSLGVKLPELVEQIINENDRMDKVKQILYVYTQVVNKYNFLELDNE